MKRFLSILTVFASVSLFAQPLAIIPQPAQVRVAEGSFTLNQGGGLMFDASKPELQNIAVQLNDHLKQFYGFTLPVNEKGKEAISFKLIKSLPGTDESYLLKVDSKGIVISAKNAAGIFYGVQSLKQILPVSQNGPLTVPYAEIIDQPRFAWHGLHLDVGRHNFPVSIIKKYIDYIAMNKLNTFK